MKLFEAKATVRQAATNSASAAALIPGQPEGPYQVRVVNDGTTMAYIAFGGSTVAATTSDLPVPPNVPCGFSVNSPQAAGARYFSVIMASGTANVSVSSGWGI